MERKRLLITDMEKEEIIRRKEYEGYTILCDDGKIRPCIGCFTCWKKTPGRCVFKDGFDQMAALLNEADEIVYSSRFTYGGFSAFIKNVFDRSIPYVLPYFEVCENEMHHKRRFEKIKDITFIFRGHDLSKEEKDMAISYVEAVCRNMRNNVKEVLFEEETGRKEIVKESDPVKGRILLINCSMRGKEANSETFLKRLAEDLHTDHEYLRFKDAGEEETVSKMADAETIILAMPLYVDGLPSNVIRLLQKIEEKLNGKGRKIYVLANLGLYESHQLVNLLSMMKYWCKKTGFQYKGAIGIGAGELIGVLIRKISFGPVRPALNALKDLAMAIDRKEDLEDRYVQPFAFPRRLYIFIANRSWDLHALKQGLKPSDLEKRPHFE